MSPDRLVNKIADVELSMNEYGGVVGIVSVTECSVHFESSISVQ